jgi:hypothetical protein
MKTPRPRAGRSTPQRSPEVLDVQMTAALLTANLANISGTSMVA